MSELETKSYQRTCSWRWQCMWKDCSLLISWAKTVQSVLRSGQQDVAGGSIIVLYVISHVNAHPETLGRTLKLFVNVTSLFACCIMSVSTVALSSGRMLTTAVD